MANYNSANKILIFGLVIFLSFIDNSLLAQDRKVRFSGFEWVVKHGDEPLDPGLNYFSNSSKNVSINKHDYLQLTIAKKDNRWNCAEVFSDSLFGYGRFIFVIKTPVGTVTKNCVFAMFLYNSDLPPYYNEIDIEFSKWGLDVFNNSQFVVYADAENLPRYRFDTKLRIPTTHVIDYYRDSVVFRSYRGEPKKFDSFVVPYESWRYVREQNPNQNPQVRVHFNYWIIKNSKPNKRKDSFEIKRFSYSPF